MTVLKLTTEVNTREHFMVLGACTKHVVTPSPWFSGEADVVTCKSEELLETKLPGLAPAEDGMTCLTSLVLWSLCPRSA